MIVLLAAYNPVDWTITVEAGTLRVPLVGCEAVTSVGKSLLVMRSDAVEPLQRYASFDDLLAGKVAEELMSGRHSSRIAARGKQGYYAWHSTDEINIVPFAPVSASSPPTTTVKLDKYDDWILGLDALTDGTLIVAFPSRTQRDIRMFDGTTGAQVPRPRRSWSDRRDRDRRYRGPSQQR